MHKHCLLYRYLHSSSMLQGGTSGRDVMQRGEQHTCTNPHSPPSPNPNLSMVTSLPSMIHPYARESAAQICIYHNCQPPITPGCQSFVNPHNLTCRVPTQASNSTVTAFLDTLGGGHASQVYATPARDLLPPLPTTCYYHRCHRAKHVADTGIGAKL